MEKKKKEPKFASTTTTTTTTTTTSATQELDTSNELLSKEEQNQSGVAFAAKNAVTSSPSQENLSSLGQQYPSIIQWPYTPQQAVEQSTQTPSPVILSRYQQLPHQPPYPLQTTPHLAQSTTPFWLPQRPGYHFTNNPPAPFQPLTPIGTADANWQVSTLNGGGPSSKNQQQMPGFCYHIGYPYPGFPGPWDPSSWWSQTQQSQPACAFTYPGACNYFSSLPPPLPAGCSATVEQNFQRGTIQLPAKLSQKHQQLWESQSAQNIQLWTVIGQLQSELADCKSRLSKLEAEASSAKVTTEEPTSQTIGTALAGQTSKRGRPKKPVPPVDALPSIDESHPRTRGRKPAVLKIQHETRTTNFEKECPNKVEDKGKANHSSATTQQQQEDDGKISCAFINTSGNIEIDRTNPMMHPFHNQIHQDIPGLQLSGIGFSSSSNMKTSSDKPEDPKTAFSILYSHVRQIKSEGASGTYTEAAANTNLGWPSNISFEDTGRNGLNISSEGFYDNGGVLRQVGKVIPGWSFVHEEDASRDLENAAIGGPGKHEDGEVMEDASSGAEDCSIQR